MIRNLIAVYRFALLAWHLMLGVLIVTWPFADRCAIKNGERIRKLARKLLGCMAIDVLVRGERTQTGPLLLVANHISWLDITVILASGHCRFVAKAEIQHWPIIGQLAKAAGSLFITRESSRAALHVMHQMVDHLCAGEVLAVFPEGTTSNGLGLLPFHANLFQAAIAADAPVQPVALQFFDTPTGQISLAPCYVDDDTFIGSVWRTLTSPPLQAVVSFGAPQTCAGRNRRMWANAARESVSSLLQQRQN